MTTDEFEVTFKSPSVHIALGTAAVETMKDSEMYILRGCASPETGMRMEI